MIRFAKRLIANGYATETILNAAPRKRSSGTHGRIIAGIVNANPGITLEAIATQLQEMGQPAPRGGEKWSRSSVLSLLNRAISEGEIMTPDKAD